MAGKKYDDNFANIGNLEIVSTREKMSEQTPQILPEIYLDADKIDQNAVFSLSNDEMDDKQLEKAIEAEKEYYMPFLKDLAPEIAAKRTNRDIKTFDWRIGSDEDAHNFERVLKGEGSWEKVEIPHFGEPLGLATTYYRTEFEISREEMEKESLWICFKGVDYKATVYVNGALVGSHTGFFAPFEFDFTLQAKVGINTLVIVVENDFIPMGSNAEYRGESFTGDKIYAATGLGYDEPLKGWHHCPPGMGIWQDVYVEGRSKLFIHDIFVRPVTTEKAEIWLEVIGTKVEKHNVSFDISIYGQNFNETIVENMLFVPDLGTVDPNQPGKPLPIERGINYLKVPVEIPSARIWETDSPWLYQVQVSLKDRDGKVVDTGKRQFGMRIFEFDTDCTPKGVYKLNGKRIKMRGVNSQGREQRCVFRKDYETLLRDYLIAKIGNVNYLRITQRPVQPEVYELCDRLGLLVQTDFPAFGSMKRNTVTEALKQVQEMEHLIRSHPSCVVSSYINEPFAYGKSRPHRCMERFELEMFFECADKMIHILNPDRVIKPIDGDYDPPVSYGLPDYHCYTCWYNGHGLDFGMLHKGYWQAVKEGWNFACGEFGMEGLDRVSVMKKYYPKHWLPENDDDVWTPATIPGDPAPQLGQMHYHFYQTPKTMADWVEESQTFQAQAMDYMVRAFRRNPKMVSFAYHLFTDAYPNGWMKAMVDVEGMPKKAFWKYKKACAPILADLRTDRFKGTSGETVNVEVRICNDYDFDVKDVFLHYQVYFDNKLVTAAKKEVEIAAWEPAFMGYLPVKAPTTDKRGTLSVQAAVVNSEGEMLSNYEIKIDVFPDGRKSLGKVFALGLSEKMRKQMTKQFDVEFVDASHVDKNVTVAVFDGKECLTVEKELRKFAEIGAKIIIFNLPVGENNVLGENVEVYTCSRRPMHFVERNIKHPMVSDFKPDDIKHWFNAGKGYISPIVYDMFEADGFEPIITTARQCALKSGGSSSIGDWEKFPAVAEKKEDGKVVRICQINFEDRLEHNPVAKILFERLFTR